MPHITLRELVRDTIQAHGYAWAAAHYRKRMCFTHFYWLAFGRRPPRLAAQRVAAGLPPTTR